ncbi:MAG: hypothetical protein ACRD3F_14105, partial [Acidobacteriaceae bacterium]
MLVFRRFYLPFLLLILCSLCAAASAQAASSTQLTYDPRVTFAPLTLPTSVNAYRSSNGAPGPSYWQNEADYVIHASLDTTNHEIHGEETITYTNNSPDALPSVWMRMEQNIYRKDSRGQILENDSS